MTHVHVDKVPHVVEIPPVSIPPAVPPKLDVHLDHAQHHLLTHSFGTLVGNLCRLPAYMAGAVASLVAFELAFRGLRQVWHGLDHLFMNHDHSKDPKPVRREWQDLTWSETPGYVCRPFSHMEVEHLAQMMAVSVAIGIVFTSAVNLAFGPVPEIYNYALSFIGPIRLSSEHWIGIQALLDSMAAAKSA